MNKITLAIVITALLIGTYAFTIEKTATQYQSKTIASIFPERISDLTPEEKIEAFEYFTATGDCSFKGIPLKGKVKFVTSFPDIKIKYVTSFPDIKVKWVTSFPDDCGEWQEVTSFPDFEVQVVTSFPDLKVQEVTSFPGMN